MSKEKLQRKKQKAISDGNLEEVFLACSELAALHCNNEEYEDALEVYKEAKRAAEAANNTINVAVAHRMIGEVYGSMLNYELAIKHQLKYLEMSRAQGDAVQEQRALANLGHMHFQRAECGVERPADRRDCLNKAKRYCKESLRVCERLTKVSRKEVVDMQARLYNNLGLILEQQGDTDTAIAYFQKAIQLSVSQDVWEMLQRSHAALASLHQSRGERDHAVKHYDRALDAAIRAAHDDKRTEADLLVAKADVLFDLPDFIGAKQCLLKAYKLNTSNRKDVEKKLKTVAAVSRTEKRLLETPEADLVTRKSLYETLGDGCSTMRSYGKALEYYYLMLETAKQLGESGEQLRPCFVSLSQTLKDNKQYELAIKYFNEELQLNANDPAEACKTTLNIAEVLELKGDDVDEVLRSYEAARLLAQTATDHRLEARCLSGMVQLLDDNDRISDARRLETELDQLKERFGPVESSSESEEENTPDIGADIRIEDISDVEMDDPSEKAVRTRKRCPMTKFRRNEKGEFPLHTACIAGNLTLVKKLLEQGHPVNVRDHNGWLPLHEACNFGHTDIVETLLDAGAAVNDRGAAGCDGTTPLLDAAMNGNFDVIRLLIERGASPTMRTNKGETVLDALIAWRNRFMKEEKRDLDPESLEQFNGLVATLESALRKAGQNPEVGRHPLHLSPPSPHRHSFPPTQPRQHSKRRSDNRDGDWLSQMPGSSKRLSSDGDDLRRREGAHCSARSSFRRSTEDILASQAGGLDSAAREYEDTMKALRRKQTVTISTQSLSDDDNPRPALVDAGAAQAADGDWLEDDLGVGGRGVKRRRMLEHPRLGDSGDSTGRRIQRGFRPISPVDSDSNESQRPQEDGGGQHDDSYDLTEPMSQPTIAAQRHTPVIQHVGPATVPSAFGVVSHTIAPSPPPPVTHAPLFPLTQPSPSQASLLSSQQVAAVKVRVESKLLLVPLPAASEPTSAPLTIAWLAEEAAKRYYSFEGVEPRLSLRTEEGALLCPGDPLALALSCREVEGIVTSWTSHPLTRRYKEACAQLNTAVDDHLERCLDVSQTSFCLALADCALDATKMAPVVQACTHQSSLQRLLLADNRLGDVGLQLLTKLIVKLPHLRELDLTCNGITGEGFNFLVGQIVEHEACKRLEVLRLSHNRLGRACLNPLGRLLAVTHALSALSIAAVGIDETSFALNAQLPFGNLESVDVGENDGLGEEGVRSMLRALSPDRVSELRLARAASTGTVRLVAHWLLGGDPRSLRTLDLTDCTDQHAAFTLLAQCLERAPQLEELHLSPQAEDADALMRLPLRVLRLTGARVLCPAMPPLASDLSCLSLDPPPTWARHAPFGLVVNDPRYQHTV